MKLIKIVTLFAIVLLLASCNKNYTKTETGFKADVDSTTIEVQFFSPEIVRIVKSKIGFDLKKKSLSVIKNAEQVSFTVSTEGNLTTASTNKVKVQLNTATGIISFLSADGKKLLNEQSCELTPKTDVNKATFEIKQAYLLDSDEYIYGLGSHQNGTMSQRNQTIELQQYNIGTAIPIMVSNKNYGVYWDNYSSTVFSDASNIASFDSEVGDAIDYYFMAGDNMDQVIANMRDLTGDAPMMPYYSYGFWQSKERYKSQDEIVGVLKTYRNLGVPIDGMVQDWRYWGENDTWNALDFLNPSFSQPEKMIQSIHDMNGHIIISCWPSFAPKTQVYKELDKKGFLFNFTTWPADMEGHGGNNSLDSTQLVDVKVYNPFEKEACDIFWNHINKTMFSIGMDGWWLDAVEPEHMYIHDTDYDEQTSLGSYRSVRNAFPLIHVGGVATHQKETSKDKRIFILTRSAFAGQQRYGANTWSGDITTDWDVLRAQISAGLNFSLSGIPYWNTDIGAFYPYRFPDGYKNSAYKEIYTRWMQFGAFCPMMRSHGTETPRELWYYGKDGDWCYDALKKAIELRYSLLPYIYSTSWNVTKNRSTMTRPLVMDFEEDKNALNVDNEYMFGKNILVCPVTKPMYVEFTKDGEKYLPGKEDFSKVKTSEVYLPAGIKWIDFWTGETLDGGQKIAKVAPIDIIPLFVKAGAIVPCGPKVQYANEEIGPLNIRIYPGANGEFTFYDDERDNYDYENGDYATINIKWDDAAQTLTIGNQEGTYKGIPENREIKIVKVSTENGIGISYNDKATKKITYSGEKVEVKL